LRRSRRSYRIVKGADEPAPSAAAHLGVLLSVGARYVVFLNGAGSLCPDVPVGSVVLPSELMREEGTSYHFAPVSVVLRTSDACGRS
jgi:uridine phosphorylase